MPRINKNRPTRKIENMEIMSPHIHFINDVCESRINRYHADNKHNFICANYHNALFQLLPPFQISLIYFLLLLFSFIATSLSALVFFPW